MFPLAREMRLVDNWQSSARGTGVFGEESGSGARRAQTSSCEMSHPPVLRVAVNTDECLPSAAARSKMKNQKNRKPSQNVGATFWLACGVTEFTAI